MIDGHTYRLSQDLARQALPNWRLSTIHHFPLFGTSQLCGSTQSNRELVPIFDTLHESRFEAYLREWDEPTLEDLECLASALVDSLLFQLVAFPGIKPRMPLSTMMAHFSIYKKLRAHNPAIKNLLEIGPGSGFLSFFLKAENAVMKYAQIEASEGFYLLQSMINDYCFPFRVDERALPQAPEAALSYFTDRNPFFETPCYAPMPPKKFRCTHYPWWRLGDLSAQEATFDMVTSNANLCEFSDQALHDYLALFKHITTPDGALFCQCLGSSWVRSTSALIDKLWEMRLAPIVFVPEAGTYRVSGPGIPTRNKEFPLGQALLVGESHPLFTKYYHREFYKGFHMGDEPEVVRMFFPKPSNPVSICKADVLDLVEARLAVHPLLTAEDSGQPSPRSRSSYATGWESRVSADLPLSDVGTQEIQQAFTAEFLKTRLRNITDSLKAERARTVVMPAGSLAAWLEANTCIMEADIIGVLDRNPTLQGSRLLGCTVEDQDRLEDLHPDVILIASARYQAELMSAMTPWALKGIRVIPIYDPTTPEMNPDGL